MKKILILSALAGTCLAVTALPAKAQMSRLYFAGYLGLSTFNSLDFSESGNAQRGEIDLDNDVNFAGALGLRFSRNTRIEAELSRRKANISSADFTGNGSFDMGGDVTTNMAMLNLYYDFDLPRRRVQPFISGGLGLAFHDVNLVDGSGLATDADDNDMAYAWQIGGGLRYRMSPDTVLTGGYRYLSTSTIELDSYEIDYSGHEFRLGLEWDFPTRRRGYRR